MIYDNLNKIDIKSIIQDSKIKKTCPFCENGFRSEVLFYTLNGASIIDCLKKT